MNTEAKHVFDTHRDTQELFQTSCGLLFFHKHAAESHAKTLKDKKVDHIFRSECEVIAEEITPEEITLEEITPEEITPEEITPEEIAKPSKTEKK